MSLAPPREPIEIGAQTPVQITHKSKDSDREIPIAAPGAAIRSVFDVKGARSEKPPMEVKLTPENQLSKQQLGAILDEALADIEQRRKLVRGHFREMFAAARTAFPLLECLERKRN